MLNIADINWARPGVKETKIKANVPGSAVAFIIDNEVVETMAVDTVFADLLVYTTDFIDATNTDGPFSVTMMHDNEELETIKCSQKLWAILLSFPIIIKYTNGGYRYAKKIAPGWSYINDDIVLLGYYE